MLQTPVVARAPADRIEPKSCVQRPCVGVVFRNFQMDGSGAAAARLVYGLIQQTAGEAQAAKPGGYAARQQLAFVGGDPAQGEADHDTVRACGKPKRRRLVQQTPECRTIPDVLEALPVHGGKGSGVAHRRRSEDDQRFPHRTTATGTPCAGRGVAGTTALGVAAGDRR